MNSTGNWTLDLIFGGIMFLFLVMTPLPYLSISLFFGAFRADETFREKLPIVLGGAPLFGLYVMLLSFVLDKWIYGDDPFTCVVWLACLHPLCVHQLTDKLRRGG